MYMSNVQKGFTGKGDQIPSKSLDGLGDQTLSRKNPSELRGPNTKQSKQNPSGSREADTRQRNSRWVKETGHLAGGSSKGKF